jgi:hypothetical protein
MASSVRNQTEKGSPSRCRCTVGSIDVTKDIKLAIRPNGPTEPRYAQINQGDKVAFRNRYQDWLFVLHYGHDGDVQTGVDYGWIPENVLTNCQEQEGTP